MKNVKKVIVHLTVVIIYIARPGQSKDCIASGGPGKGLQCVFPFKYKDIEYNTCTSKNKHVTNNKLWCSTMVDGEGNHVIGKDAWGNCDENCPLQKSVINPSVSEPR